MHADYLEEFSVLTKETQRHIDIVKAIVGTPEGEGEKGGGGVGRREVVKGEVSSGDQRGELPSLVAKIDSEFREMNLNLSGYENEVRMMDLSHRRSHLPQVKECKAKLLTLQREWLTIAVGDRDEAGAGQLPNGTSRRAALAIEKAERGTATLLNTRAVAEETEAIGRSVALNLYSQRETIGHVKANTGKASDSLDECNAGLARMDTYSAKLLRWWNGDPT